MDDSTELQQIKAYWDDQARKFRNDPRATTQDFFMRQIEIRYAREFLAGFQTSQNILDVGCGNGYGTLMLAEAFPQHRFVGGDYSKEMIDAARSEATTRAPDRVDFRVMDVLHLARDGRTFDIVVSDRCLINLGNAANRKAALTEIAQCVVPGGYLLLIENFIEGQNELNTLRCSVNLPEIPVRWHNSFFSRAELADSTRDYFTLQRFENISSLYYLVTRVVYSKLCQEEGREPDYDHPIYRVAAQLPFAENYGPICAAILKRRLESEIAAQ